MERGKFVSNNVRLGHQLYNNLFHNINADVFFFKVIRSMHIPRLNRKVKKEIFLFFFFFFFFVCAENSLFLLLDLVYVACYFFCSIFVRNAMLFNKNSCEYLNRMRFMEARNVGNDKFLPEVQEFQFSRFMGKLTFMVIIILERILLNKPPKSIIFFWKPITFILYPMLDYLFNYLFFISKAMSHAWPYAITFSASFFPHP